MLIVGGGIAGMALAIGLRRAGIAAEIVEIDKDWRVYGAGITITGPTLRALDRLGLLDRGGPRGLLLRRHADLRCRGPGDRGLASERPADGPAHSERWRHPAAGAAPDFAAATRASGATVRLGVGVAAIEQTGGRSRWVSATARSASYDLVVGADGIHSRLRDMLFPDAPKPAFTGQGCWRAVVPRPAAVDCAHVYVGGR